MKSKKLMLVLGLFIAVSLVLGACQPQQVVVTQVVKETQVVQETVEVVVTEEVEVLITPTPEPITRTGAWVDRIVMVEEESQESAVTRLQAGEIDVYAFTCDDSNVFDTVKADPNLTYATSFGSYNEFTFNPAEFTDGRLNPFTNPKIREAMNWAFDRNYVVQEITGGLSVPKYLPITSAFPDYARYVGIVRAIELTYAYNLDKAKEVVTAEMQAMGATLGADGKWTYNGAPVTIVMIIRTEDERRTMGDYLGTQLETLGFTVDRQYKSRTEASPIWVRSDPAEGLWNIYTGGWITTEVSRDQGSNFSFFYTPRDYPIPLHQAYKPAEEFDALALKLRNNEFKTLEERDALFEQILPLAMQDSVRVWINDAISFAPFKANVAVTYDLAGSISGSWLWPFTVKFTDRIGGTIRIAQPGLLVDPWNPVAGSNWIYDMMPIRATGDRGAMPDPYTGLSWPQRIESAQVVMEEGLPVIKTLDWVDLQFAPAADLTVPADAWVDWDATAGKFITAAEKYPEGLPTAKSKITVVYPKDLFTTVKWHDGSPVSVADFVMNIITTFDFGKEDSPMYDPSLGESLAAFLDHFKGVQITSTDPLTIVTYDDLYYLDAEYQAYANTWWPMYTYGPGPWHTVTVGMLAELGGELAFSADKAQEKEVEWTSFVSGPSLEILKKYLDQAATDAYVPFATAMADYLPAEEVAARYTNLKRWYAEQGHFWVGSGPFYLDKVFPIEGTLTLNRFEGYPDLVTKWDRFAEPKVAVVELDGPGTVTTGTEAAFDVYVDFKDAPYPASEIQQVKWLLFDAKGALAASGEATFVADGQYQVVLSADVTKALEAGSNKLEVAVSPTVVSIPSFASFSFVTVAP